MSQMHVGLVKIGDFRQIAGYISKMVQDRCIVSIKVDYEVVCTLSFWDQAVSLVCRLNIKSTAITHVKVLQYGVHLGWHDLLKFWEISANIPEMVQDRDIDTVED